ncbi:hypothetical protein ISCGN_008325, partial [Ixodes scapularis]
MRKYALQLLCRGAESTRERNLGGGGREARERVRTVRPRPPRTDAASEPRAASRRRGPSPGLRRTCEASGGGPSMSSRLLALWLALALVLVLLLDDAQGAKGRGGKRGRGRMRSSGSARYIFYTHPKRKEYYDNPNKKWGIKLDHRAEIFQNLNGAVGDVELLGLDSEPYLHNSAFGTVPLVIHGNGPSK